jgi:hypothetical protein
MSDTVTMMKQPKIGHSVTIAKGPLEGVVGIVSEYRESQCLIELPTCGPGILVLVDPEYCEPVT